MNRFRKTALLSLTAALLAVPAAKAGHPQDYLYRLAGEIRGQTVEVDARLKSLLPYCRDASDVQRELARLCYDLDKFERRLAEGVFYRHDLKKLEWLAEKIDDHADEVWDELQDVLEDLDDRRHDFDKRGFVKPGFVKQGRVSSGYHQASTKRSSFRLTIGKRGPRFAVVSNRVGGARLPYYLVAAPGPVFIEPAPVAGIPWGEVHALKGAVKQLNYLTQRLDRMLDD